MNNDGFDDLIAGAPFDDNNGNLSGSARVFISARGGWPIMPCPAPPPFCFGDADNSGDVTFADITEVLTNFNAVCP